MKNIIISTMAVLVIALCGCSETEALEERQQELMQQNAQLEAEYEELNCQYQELQNMVIEEKIENGTARYYVNLKVSQEHYTLDIEAHLKDALNELTVEIPVDKEFYDSVENGQILSEEFRTGSAVVSGSFGSWKIEVESKEVR